MFFSQYHIFFLFTIVYLILKIIVILLIFIHLLETRQNELK